MNARAVLLDESQKYQYRPSVTRVYEGTPWHQQGWGPHLQMTVKNKGAKIRIFLVWCQDVIDGQELWELFSGRHWKLRIQCVWWVRIANIFSRSLCTPKSRCWEVNALSTSNGKYPMIFPDTKKNVIFFIFNEYGLLYSKWIICTFFSSFHFIVDPITEPLGWLTFLNYSFSRGFKYQTKKQRETKLTKEINEEEAHVGSPFQWPCLPAPSVGSAASGGAFGESAFLSCCWVTPCIYSPSHSLWAGPDSVS